MNPFSVIMSQVRFELTTYGLEDRCSIQLSHCDITRTIIEKMSTSCNALFKIFLLNIKIALKYCVVNHKRVN